jgi:hypothetical protein
VFLLLFTLSVYCGYRGFVGRRGWWQVGAAGSFCLALLSYEFALLFVGGLGLYLLVRLAAGGWEWYRGRSTLVAGALVLAGVGLFWVLALALRAGTLAGPLAEIRQYVSPGLRLSGPGFYWERLLAEYWALVAVGLVALPALARARPEGTLYLGTLVAVAFLVPSFVIQAKREQHYALPLLPLLAVVASAGTVRLAGMVADWLHHLSRDRQVAETATGTIHNWLPAIALLAVFVLAPHRDAGEAVSRVRPLSQGATWLDVLRDQGIQPTDLIVAEAPTIVEFYLGRGEFYIHPEGYERYTYQAPDAVRSIYTDSIVLRERGDFERLVERPHAGRTVWVVGRQERLQRLADMMDGALLPSITRSADQVIQTRDHWLLLRLTLPRRAG